MRKQVALVMGAALLWLSLLAGPAGAGPDVAAQSSDEWEYRWEVRADGTSQVSRRKAGEAAGEWTPAGIVPQEIVEIVGSRLEPGVALARTRQALFRTEDAGGQWQQMSGLPDWPTAVALGHEQAGLIYLGTLTGGVFRSVDAGTTWEPLPWNLEMMGGTFLEVTALAVHPEDDETVYAAAGHWLGSTEQTFTPSGIAISLDAGARWQVFYRAELDDPRVTGLEPDPDQPLRVLARSEEGTRWLTMEGAAIPEPRPDGVEVTDNQTQPVPVQQAGQVLSPARAARERAPAAPATSPGVSLSDEGWVLLALAAVVLVGAGMWVWRWPGCSLRSLRH